MVWGLREAFTQQGEEKPYPYTWNIAFEVFSERVRVGFLCSCIADANLLNIEKLH